MFTKSTQIYDELYHFKDYQAAAVRLDQIIRDRSSSARSILDVACGTGKHLAELQHQYEVAGVDINPEMLEIAARRCPSGSFHLSDMVEMNVGRKFDVVTCLFSSIAYVKTVDRLNAAVARLADHVAPGGMLLIEPFFGPDEYWVDRVTANHYDRPEMKITWMYTSERDGLVARLNIHYLVGRPQGVEHFTELHEIGLFTRDEYRKAYELAGFPCLDYDSQGLFGRGMWIGTRNETERR